MILLLEPTKVQRLVSSAKSHTGSPHTGSESDVEGQNCGCVPGPATAGHVRPAVVVCPRQRTDTARPAARLLDEQTHSFHHCHVTYGICSVNCYYSTCTCVQLERATEWVCPYPCLGSIITPYNHSQWHPSDKARFQSSQNMKNTDKENWLSGQFDKR